MEDEIKSTQIKTFDTSSTLSKLAKEVSPARKFITRGSSINADSSEVNQDAKETMEMF